MLTLDVINKMLGTLGEAPLNSLSDPHTFKYAANSELSQANTKVQVSGTGHWFNREVLTIQRNSTDGKFYLPGDAASVIVPGYPGYVQRGNILYDVERGTPLLDETEVKVILIRLIPFDSLPMTARFLVAAEAVLAFQFAYDGDSQRTAVLNVELTRAKMEFNAEATRQAQVNLLDTDLTIQKLRRNIPSRRYIPR